MALRDYVLQHLTVVAERGEEVQCHCPACGDTRGKFSINVVTGFANCPRATCGWRGSFIQLVSLVQDLPWDEAMREAKKWGGGPVVGVANRRIAAPKNTAAPGLPDDYRPLLGGAPDTSPWRLKALDYLHRRGVTDAEILEHRIGYAMAGSHRGRVLLPVHNDANDIVFYQARKFAPLPGIKTLSPESNPDEGGYVGRSRCLFGLHLIGLNEDVVITEGIFDALAVNRCLGGNRAVACFGHAPAAGQALLLAARAPHTVTLFLDPDVPVYDAIQTALPLRNTVGVEVRVVKYPKGTTADPDELAPEQVRDMLATAPTVTFAAEVDALLGAQPRVAD